MNHTTHTSLASRKAAKRYGSLPRLSFTHESVAKAIQTLSNLRDFTNGHNDSALNGFLDSNPEYYHGIDDALTFAALAIADLQAKRAERIAIHASDSFKQVEAYAQSIDSNISAGEVSVLHKLLFGSKASVFFITEVRHLTAAERAYLDLLAARGLASKFTKSRPQTFSVEAASPSEAAIKFLQSTGHLTCIA